jgi:hypothetical protein
MMRRSALCVEEGRDVNARVRAPPLLVDESGRFGRRSSEAEAGCIVFLNTSG